MGRSRSIATIAIAFAGAACVDVSGFSGADSGDSGAAFPDGGGGADAEADASVDADAGGCRPTVPADCGANEYCRLTSCEATSGMCTPRPSTAPNNLAPVCGCDGVAYWNEDVAKLEGANVRNDGPCPVATARKCGGTQAPCSKGRCRLETTASNCATVSAGGYCWAPPPICPPLETGYVDCNAGNCVGLCAAVLAQQLFYGDAVTCN